MERFGWFPIFYRFLVLKAFLTSYGRAVKTYRKLKLIRSGYKLQLKLTGEKLQLRVKKGQEVTTYGSVVTIYNRAVKTYRLTFQYYGQQLQLKIRASEKYYTYTLPYIYKLHY